MFQRARALEQQGDRAAALVQYKAVLQTQPGLVQARLSLGKLLLEAGDAEGAAVEFQRAATDKAPQGEVYPLWAQAVVRSGDYKRAVHLINGWKLDEPRALAPVQVQLAMAWMGLGEAARAQSALQKALDTDPKHVPARVLQARFLAGQGNLNQAQILVDALLAEDDRSVETQLLRAELLEVRGDRKAALAAAEKALAIDPRSIGVLSWLVRTRILNGNPQEAGAHVETLKKVAGWHPATVLAEAELAVAREDYAKARERVQKLLAVLPDNETALTLAGVIETLVGSPVQATAYFRKALSLEPRLDNVRVELARSEIRLGQYADAIATLQPLVSKESAPALALALASDAQVRMGNLKQADALLKRAVATAPDNTRLQTMALMRQLQTGDAARPLTDLQTLAGKVQDTIADEALFTARMARGEYAAALAVLDNMAKKAPGKATHQELRGRVFLAQRQFAEARAAFEQALKLDKGLFGAVASLVALDLLESKPNDAMARVQRVVDADPQHSVALLALAELKARYAGSSDEAERLLKAAVAASPLAAEPRIRLIETSLRKRRFKDAVAFAREAIAAIPGDARLLEVAGRAQLESGDVEQAASTFRSMAGAAPNAALPYIRLARVYIIQGNREAALTALRSAVEAEPSSIDAQSGLVEVLVTMNRGNEAQEYVRRQRLLRPADPKVFSLEAAYHLRLKAPEQAIAVLREGVAKTRDSELAGKLFSLLLQLGRDADAGSFGAEWMKQRPNDAAFDYLMSVRDIARGELKSAEARLRRVLQVYPTNGLALNNMAWLLVKTGGTGAVEYARRAVSVMPDQPDLMDTLAMALAADNQMAEALAIQQRALELSDGRPEIRLGLVRLLVKAGDKGAAREELAKLEKLGTGFRDHAEVKSIREKL